MTASRTRQKWWKSSYSNSPNGSCVEVGDLGGSVGVRDTKDPEGGGLVFAPKDFHSFIRTVKAS